jgi:hypothetical protein
VKEGEKMEDTPTRRTAAEDYPALRALAEMLPDRAGGDQAAKVLAEIDRLRAALDLQTQITYQHMGAERALLESGRRLIEERDRLRAAVSSPERAATCRALDRLREMYGIEATDYEDVFAALEKYNAHLWRRLNIAEAADTPRPAVRTADRRVLEAAEEWTTAKERNAQSWHEGALLDLFAAVRERRAAVGVSDEQ